MCENWKVKVGVDYVNACKKTEALSGKSRTTGSVSDDETFVPFLKRLTPKQRKKFERGMKRLRRRFHKKFAKSQRKKPNDKDETRGE